MIQEIHIRDLGVIREARLDFRPGFNVISGETGAGKTMVLTALGLLLGQRADSGSVRSGQAQTLVEGRIQVLNSALKTKIEELGGSLDDDELVMNRIVSTEGKSRASLGGVSVPVAAIGEIAGELVVVHGQADQIRLKSASAQREALDNFAGHSDLLSAEYRDAFNSWQSTLKVIADLENDSASRQAELQNLKFSVEEISKVNPTAGEEVELADLANRLSNLEGLRTAATNAHEALSSENDNQDALGLLAQAKKILEHESDSALQELAVMLGEQLMQLRHVSGELASFLASLDSDSELSLDQVQSRRAEINGLLRKYGDTTEQVIAYRDSAEEQLVRLDNSDERVQELGHLEKSQHADVLKLAKQLSDSRNAAAEELATAVTAELQGLAMSEAQLVVRVEAAEQLTSYGADNVSLLLSSYKGAEPRPIGKGASGGREISRIMLAIEVVLAKDRQATTFIFDEVDAGVGGAAAIEVGMRLARLARQAQVIVVTHLAQVAAFADHQLRVLKSSNEDVTETDVVVLGADERLEELARMLSGLSDSSSAREHAAELMSLAKTASTN